MVGATGFEPATSCSQSRRSARLSYAPQKGLFPPALRAIRRCIQRQVPGRVNARRLVFPPASGLARRPGRRVRRLPHGTVCVRCSGL